MYETGSPTAAGFCYNKPSPISQSKMGEGVRRPNGGRMRASDNKTPHPVRLRLTTFPRFSAEKRGKALVVCSPYGRTSTPYPVTPNCNPMKWLQFGEEMQRSGRMSALVPTEKSDVCVDDVGAIINRPFFRPCTVSAGAYYAPLRGYARKHTNTQIQKRACNSTFCVLYSIMYWYYRAFSPFFRQIS